MHNQLIRIRNPKDSNACIVDMDQCITCIMVVKDIWEHEQWLAHKDQYGMEAPHPQIRVTNRVEPGFNLPVIAKRLNKINTYCRYLDKNRHVETAAIYNPVTFEREQWLLPKDPI